MGTIISLPFVKTLDFLIVQVGRREYEIVPRSAEAALYCFSVLKIRRATATLEMYGRGARALQRELKKEGFTVRVQHRSGRDAKMKIA